MNIIFHDYKSLKIAELRAEGVIITKVRDALDLIADADYNGAKSIIIREENISPEFFRLSSGLAGEILQKCVNYKTSLAIIGNFAKYESNSLRAFILECNRGSQFFFVETPEQALDKLSKN